MTEWEKQKLQVRARIIPYIEYFGWVGVPLFERKIGGGVGGITSPCISLAPSISGSSSQENNIDLIERSSSYGRMIHYSSGFVVIVEIPNLNRVKESYVEDLLQV